MAMFERHEIVGKVHVVVKINTGITLWQAIKLRLAGKNYEPIAREIAEAIKSRIMKDTEIIE